MSAARIHGVKNKCALPGDNDVSEVSILRQKLNSKAEALLILSRELAECQLVRDEYKSMADQLRERCSVLRKRLETRGPSPWFSQCEDRKALSSAEESFASLLCDLKEENKRIKMENELFREQLSDCRGDLKVLREQFIAGQTPSLSSLSSLDQIECSSPKSSDTTAEIQDMVRQLEQLKIKCRMLESDLQSLLDEKEELVSERDAYKHKADRLNRELVTALQASDGEVEHDTNRTVVDIDSLLLQNRYLQERLKQTQEEKSMCLQTLSKYKSMLDKQKSKFSGRPSPDQNGIIHAGVNVAYKEVHKLLESSARLPISPATIADLRSLSLALFEALNDKNLALTHQKKANKMLGEKVSELELKSSSSPHSPYCPWTLPYDYLGVTEPAKQRKSRKSSAPEWPKPASIQTVSQSLSDKDLSELSDLKPLVNGSGDCAVVDSVLIKKPDGCRSTASSIASSITMDDGSVFNENGSTDSGDFGGLQLHRVKCDTDLVKTFMMDSPDQSGEGKCCHNGSPGGCHDDELPVELQRMVNEAMAAIDSATIETHIEKGESIGT